jgi:hypothetical protein
MGANLSSKTTPFFDDLKTSWFFRIYVFTWVFCALLTFIALVVLGQRATVAQKEQAWRLWIENSPSISYPSFIIKTNDDENLNTINNVICRFGVGHPMLVPTAGCANGEPNTKCMFVEAESYAASQDSNSLDCSINITAPPSADRILMIQIYEKASYGASITWLQPNNNAIILLTKAEIKPSSGSESIIWGHTVIYHSTVDDGTFFNVKFVFDTFAVFHWQEDSGYDTWMSVGGIGGFAFFMLIIHTIFMAIVTLCIPNESKFLKGGASAVASSDYQSVR